MKEFKGKTLLSAFGIIIAMVLMGLAIFFTSGKVFLNKNAEIIKNDASIIKTPEGDFVLSDKDIISQATKLLGTKYSFGSKGGTAYTTGKTISVSSVKTNGIDCSGLVWWSLTNAINAKGIPGTTNFRFNNPVPVDTDHWVQDSNGHYWSENKYWTYNSTTGRWTENNSAGTKAAKNANLKLGGQYVNILKASDAITSNLRYYEYIDDNGTKKELPAGTIIIGVGSLLRGLSQNIENHAWIYLGDFGTVNPAEVVSILKNRYDITVDVNNVKQISQTNTHWRIESASGSGVTINNADPDFGASYEVTTSTGTKKLKGVGPVWAFQVASETTITGKYNLTVQKTDMSGNAISVGTTNLNSLFTIERDNANQTGTPVNDSTIKYGDFDINSIGEEKITVKESGSVPGYAPYNGTIEITVNKTLQSKAYVTSIKEVKVGGTVLTKQNGTYSNEYVVVTESDGNISIQVKNPTIDLALKKTIITVNDTTVTTENSFNTSRHEQVENEIRTVTTDLDEKSNTNASYYMNKTPVEVNVGDEVRYRIRVYNEGETNAYASKITDYIPTGLKVKDVYYRDETTPLRQTGQYTNSKGVYYVYNEENNVLEISINPNVNLINATSNPGTVIPAYSTENGLQYDYFDVICEVQENATGVLTNMAEISAYTYTTLYGNTPKSTDVDIDSTADNWNNPNDAIHDNNKTTDKSTDKWKNYANAKQSLIELNNFDAGYIAQDAGRLGHKGDDDDFDKLLVIKGEYNISVEKYDLNGDKIEVGQDKIEEIFSTKLNGNLLEVDDKDDSAIKYEAVKINTDNYSNEDIILVEEVKAPEGFAKYEYKVKVYIAKEKISGLYIAYVSKIELLNSNDEVVETKVNSNEINKTNWFIYFTDGLIQFNNGNIKIYIKDRKIDVALKKSITKVTHENVTSEVKMENGFNSNRGYENDIADITVEPLKIETNAFYRMNKKPVEVNKGDLVEYQIRIYNEGEVPAGASVIKDYIPVGLKVKDVYYKDSQTALVKDAATGNTYSYDETNGVLTIKLKDVDLIQAFDETTVSSDYVRVVCEVKDTATGVLTNVAEIAKYYDNEQNEIDKDIDSTAGNWKNPNDNLTENNDTTNKGTDEWRNYSNDEDVNVVNEIIDAQDEGLNDNFGDDDDFDKIVIKENGSYEIKVKKVSISGEELEGVTFNMEKGTSLNGKDFIENNPTLYTDTTNSDGIATIEAQHAITQDNYGDVDKYRISEINLGANTSYTKLDTDISIFITKELKNGKYDLKDWYVVKDGDYYTNINYGRTCRKGIKNGEGTLEITEGSLKYEITATIENNVITITVPNYDENQTQIRLIKKDKDTGELISGAKMQVIEQLPDWGARVDDTTDANGQIDATFAISASTTQVQYWVREYKPALGYENIFKNKTIVVTANVVNGVIQNGAGDITVAVKNNMGMQDDPTLTSYVSAYRDPADDHRVILEIENEKTENIDLALKKVITEINNDGTFKEVNGNNFDSKYDRVTTGDDKVRIDTTPLDNGFVDGQAHDAIYYLNKTPILVKTGSKIRYELRIYNEGEAAATASEIKDYLPDGLKLVKVYYNNNELNANTDYVYDETHNLVTINVLEDELIPAYVKADTTTGTAGVLSYKYVTVECEVLDSAKGVLTNVSEITEYEYEKFDHSTEKVDNDYDSETENWENPTGEDVKEETTRNIDEWIEYSADHTIGEGAFDDYKGQEDDDDFEKIIIIQSYKYRLRKVNAIGHAPIEGVTLKINDEEYITNEDGYTETLNADITESGTVMYAISEPNIAPRENQGFVGFNHIYFNVVTTNADNNGYGINYVGISYNVNHASASDSIQITGDEFTKTYSMPDNQMRYITFKLIATKDENDEYLFTFEIENLLEDDRYAVFLKKVDTNNDVIEGVRFGLNGSMMTGNNEIISSRPYSNIYTRSINRYNYTTTDRINITEIEAPKGLIRLTDNLELSVEKELTESKNSYRIKNMTLKYGNLTSVPDGENKVKISDVPVGNSGKKVDITAELTDISGMYYSKAIIITIPNEEVISNEYSIAINKVDGANNNNYLTGAKFTTSYETTPVANQTMPTIITPVTTDGTANYKQIVSSVIDTTNYEVADEYTIEETVAPEGYFKLKNPITVKVEKRLNSDNTKYEISNVYINGNKLYSSPTYIHRLELLGTEKTATLRVTRENNNILLQVENVKKNGAYAISVNKVDNLGNYLAGVEFNATGTNSNNDNLSEAIRGPQITDGTNMSKVLVTKSITLEEKDYTDTYLITENAPEGYYELKDPIEVKVTKKINETDIGVDKIFINNQEVTEQGISFEADLKDTDYKANITASINEQNNRVDIIVENVIKDGEYEIYINKIDEDGNYIAGINFETVYNSGAVGTTTEPNITSPITTDGTENAKKVVENVIGRDNYQIVDTYTITEVGEVQNYYKLADPITVTVEKELTDNGYVINNVKINNQTFEKGLLIINDLELVGTDDKATLYASTQNNVITIKVENFIKDGKYRIRLGKTDNFGWNISGAKFEITGKDNQNNSLADNFVPSNIVSVNGDKATVITDEEYVSVLVAQEDMSSENVNLEDTYTIKETGAPNGYYVLDEDIVVKITKKTTDSGYEIEKVFVNNNEVTGNEYIYYAKLKDTNTKAEIKVTLRNETVIVNVENKLKIGTYKILLNKVDENFAGVPGAVFEIEETDNNENSEKDVIESTITSSGNPVQIASKEIIDETLKQEDTFEITEITAPNGYYKLENPIVVKVVKEITYYGYEVDYCYVNGQIVSNDNELEIENVKLEGVDLSKASATIYASKNDDIILIQVTNILKDGRYNLEIEKVDENGSPLLKPQAGFSLSNKANEVLTDANTGIAKLLENAEILADKVETADEYIITETTIPTGYYGLEKPVNVKVNKIENDANLGVKNVEVSVEGAGKVTVSSGETKKLENVPLTDGTKTALTITLSANNLIKITMPNKNQSGSYKILLDKVDKNGKSISGAEFDIKETDTNKKSENDVISTPAKPTGKEVQIISKDILAETHKVADTYTITETKAPNGYYRLVKPITLKVEKKLATDGYVANKVTINGTKELTSGTAVLTGLALEGTDKTAKVTVSFNNNVIKVVVENLEIKGSYNFTITKKDSTTAKVIEDETTTFDVDVYSNLSDVTLSGKVTLKNVNGNIINTKGIKAKTNGVARIDNIDISYSDVRSGTYYFVITETQAPDKYSEIDYKVVVPVEFKLENGKYVAVHKTSDAFALVNENGKVVRKQLKEMSTNENECTSTEQVDLTINVNVPNKEKEFDLSLRKFISKVNNSALTGEDSREPVVDLSTLINGDPSKNGEKTATYTHTKDALLVNPTDIVEYTVRVYNEGELDGYASEVIDDIPSGVTMVAPEYDESGKPLNQNAEYRWVMYKEISENDTASENAKTFDGKLYVETKVAEEATLIVTDYLSKANGEARMSTEDKVNPNLMKAFNGTELSYKDLKIQFKVKQGNDPNKIITNYAQISKHEYKDGTEIIDRDSTPNKWINNEDDQDIENIRVTWFDLALYKWVSSTLVTEDGKTKEYPSGHTQKNKDNIVNVTIAKDKLKSTVVKFKWTIKVENQGIIAGYAKELKDHIPSGLKFVKEDNTDYRWVEQEDGSITTDYLKDTLLQPGETAEVTVVLTWINNENNLGVKVNSAEISDDYNEYDEKDIDSTPDNFKGKPAEDDEDQDEVRLNVRTGNGMEITYIIIGTLVLAVVAGGIVGIRKYVLR